jgi:cell division septum initiation protein DivIVA
MTIDSYESDTAAFRTRLLGFDKNEVRACLQNLARDHDEARRQVERLTVRLKLLEEESRDRGPAVSPLAAQVEKVLASAHQVAEDVKTDAQAAAKKVLVDAQEEAARLRGQAERDAAALTATAGAQLRELHGEIDRMTERRSALQHELNHAAERLDEIGRLLRSAAPEPAPRAPLPPRATATV